MGNKAVYIKEPYQVEFIDLEMPEIKKDQALIKVMYGGVCGSDFKVYLGKMNNVTYPKIAGHEFSGEIVEIGVNDQGLKPGMIVTSTPYYGCGTCYCCRQGWYNCCQNNKTMGVGCDGGFRQYVAVPVSKIVDGRGLDAKTLALIEPFSNSLNLVKRICPKKGETMLIFGAGPIGLFSMIAAKEKGAFVYMVDTSVARLEFAQKMGADGVLNISKKDLKEYVKEQTGDEGFNICVEAVGSGDVFKQCIDAVSFHGRICIIGMTTVDFTFNHSIISYKEITLVGARNSTRQDFIDNIDSVASGRIDVEYINRMITAEYDFQDIVSMYKELESTYTSNMKVIIDFTKQV